MKITGKELDKFKRIKNWTKIRCVYTVTSFHILSNAFYSPDKHAYTRLLIGFFASRNLSTISQTSYQLERIVALYRRPSFPRMFLSPRRRRPSTRKVTTRWDSYSQEKGFPCRGRATLAPSFQLTLGDKSWKRSDSTKKDIYIYIHRVSLIKQYANIEEGEGGPF